jgi:bacillolysin
MSDIFGALVDRATGATGDDIWTIGEDVFTPGTANDGGLRNMKDPAEKGNYDWYPTRYIGTNDYGGVHSNSGIANLAFYLLVMGGPHPRGKSPDINVTGIGFEAAADIFYKANTMCLTPDSSFWFARHCTAETYGGEYQSSVRQAWDAVGVPNIVSIVCYDRSWYIILLSLTIRSYYSIRRSRHKPLPLCLHQLRLLGFGSTNFS